MPLAEMTMAGPRRSITSWDSRFDSTGSKRAVQNAHDLSARRPHVGVELGGMIVVILHRPQGHRTVHVDR